MPPFQGGRCRFEPGLPLSRSMESQRCGSCGLVKPIAEFNLRSRITLTRHTTCRQCQSGFKRNFYNNNRQAYLRTSAGQKAEAIQRNRTLIREYLSAHPCVDCGEADVVVLEFDHLRGKERSISQVVIDGVSWEKIEREIEKCEVRCANCHRKKTAQERGWYKNLGL